MTSRRPLALITGASAGIGRDIAELLASRGYDLILIARREDRLRELAQSLHGAHGVDCRALTADLTNFDEREKVLTVVESERERLDVLISNAGLGTHGYFHEIPLARDLALIELNVAALTHLTKRVLPWMLERKAGRIMHVASVAAFQPGPLMATYYASKAFVLSFSEALSAECEGTGVTVTAVCPGPTTTEFQRVAGFAEGARPGGPPPMTSREVARIGVAAMFRGDPVAVTGWRNKIVVQANRVLPRGVMARMVKKIQLQRRS